VDRVKVIEAQAGGQQHDDEADDPASPAPPERPIVYTAPRNRHGGSIPQAP
jgi:hypothetical protein